MRIGLIGMVTPACRSWDPVEREDYAVSDPLEETQKIIDEIQFDVDILIGVYHMGIEEEHDTADSGVRDIAMACPDFDVIIASHNHRLVEEQYINGVLIVENRSHGETMADITLSLEPEDDTWVVSSCSARTIYAKDYDPDPEIAELMARYDRRAKREMRELE